MQLTVKPSIISGAVQAPASKSVMQRACAAALLSTGKTFIYNYGISNDDKAALQIIQKLGAEVKILDDQVLMITSDFMNRIQNPTNSEITQIICGESGLSVRMFTPIVALANNTFILSGEGSLLNRPMFNFEEILSNLDVEVKTSNGKLPVFLKGTLRAKPIELIASEGSQFLTGLLYAYSAQALLGNKSIIQVRNLTSKPYINLTIDVLKKFGLPAPTHNNYNTFSFSSSESNLNKQNDIHFTVEGDWSNAAFLIVAAAISGNNVKIKGLNFNSVQGDKKILDALRQSGAALQFNFDDESFIISKSQLLPIAFDATDTPDLFPPLVVLAAYAKGTSEIKGVHRLLHKESNRVQALVNVFSALGVIISVENDVMYITGTGTINGGKTVDSHNDHRIAMSAAIAALHAQNSVTITNAQAVNKSYPNFYKHLQQLGAGIQYH